MNLSQQAGLAALQAVTAKYNSGTLLGYQGLLPATPEASIGSATLLITFNFSANAFPSPLFDANGYYKANASFTANPVLPSANGTISFMRALQSGGSTVIADFTIAQSWAPSLAVLQNQYILANGNSYICTTSGTTASTGSGPSSTGTNIIDGTAHWMYLALGSTDLAVSNAVLSTSVQFSLPFLWQVMPCV